MDGLEGSPGRGSSSAVLAGAVLLDVHPNSPHRCHGARTPVLGQVGPHLRTLGHAPFPFALARVPGQRPAAALPGRGGRPMAPEPPGRQRGAPARPLPLPPGSTQPPSPVPRHAPPGPQAGAEAISDTAVAGLYRLGLSGP